MQFIPRHHARRAVRRGLSLVEMLIALAISAMLLTAALSALDVMFKGYETTTESASTHVVSRIVMSRLQGMIRTGETFGPIPGDVLDGNQNPMAADYFEFIARTDPAGAPLEMIRIEFRLADGSSPNRTWSAINDNPPANPGGAGSLWYQLYDATTDPPTLQQEHPLLPGVQQAAFTLIYNVGPRLRRATVDLTIEPNDSEDLTVETDATAQTFRLVASSAPRTGAE